MTEIVNYSIIPDDKIKLYATIDAVMTNKIQELSKVKIPWYRRFWYFITRRNPYYKVGK